MNILKMSYIELMLRITNTKLFKKKSFIKKHFLGKSVVKKNFLRKSVVKKNFLRKSLIKKHLIIFIFFIFIN
jgi:hypothetical protein